MWWTQGVVFDPVMKMHLYCFAHVTHQVKVHLWLCSSCPGGDALMSDKVTSDIVMSSIRDVTLWFGCKSLDSSSSCFCCIFIFYVFMPMMSSHWKLIRRRLLSELQLRFNFCTNVLFSGFIYLFIFLSHTNVNIVEGSSLPLYRDFQNQHVCVGR